MIKRYLVIGIIALAGAVGVVNHVTAANADLADRCRIEGLSPTLTGAGKPTIKFKVYSCPNSNYPWNVQAWCAKSTDSGGSWSHCANTTTADVNQNGNETWSVPVGNGSWGCSSNAIYATFAEIWDPDGSEWVVNGGNNIASC